MHFDLDNYEEQLESLIAFLRPYLNDQDLSEVSFDVIQQTLVDFIEEQIRLETDVTDIVEKRLWLQIESDEIRENVQYAVISAYAQQLIADGESAAAIQVVTDYVLEKELLEMEQWARQGQELLNRIVDDAVEGS